MDHIKDNNQNETNSNIQLNDEPLFFDHVYDQLDEEEIEYYDNASYCPMEDEIQGMRDQELDFEEEQELGIGEHANLSTEDHYRMYFYSVKFEYSTIIRKLETCFYELISNSEEGKGIDENELYNSMLLINNGINLHVNRILELQKNFITKTLNINLK